MTENELKILEKKTGQRWLSMLEASRGCSYSQEYLSLLARRGKIFAEKIGRNWYTTEEALGDYLKKQSLTITVPRNVVARLTTSESTPEEPEGGEDLGVGHEGHSKIFEEFERLNPQLFRSPAAKEKLSPQVIAPVTPKPEVQIQEAAAQKDVLKKLDNLSDSLQNFAEKITRKVSEPVQASALTSEQEEFINIESQSLGFRFRRFDDYARSIMSNPRNMMAATITAVVVIFLVVGGFSFGQVDQVTQYVRNAFKDADTLQGHFPGTHANEVLVLDKAGNISIFGHVETQGQLRSHAPDGVAPIVVDSMTKVDNLNADYFDNLDSKDFTLAFVTSNGNITTENVFLEGNVEVGKTLTVKGAFNLQDALNVYGKLGVFSEAFFAADVTLGGGNLILQKGTISISNTNLIKNLNAEFLDGLRKGDINLDFVLSSGSTTSKALTVGGLTSTGTITANGPGFFNSSVWSPAGSFGTVGAQTASFGSKANPSDSSFEVYSKEFVVDGSGNTTIGGNLIVNDFIKSNLVPSGSFDLGSTANRWDDIYGITAHFDNLIVSGTASASHFITTGGLQVNGGSSVSYSRFGTNTTSHAISGTNSLLISGDLEVDGTAYFDGATFGGTASASTFYASSGTAASPSFSFNSDKDTGLFNPALNQLGLSTLGVERLRINSLGNVGIGTTDPQRLLHLSTTNGGTLTAIAIENTDTTNNNGNVVSFRSTTTGVGGASFQEYAGFQGKVIEHDAATFQSAFSIFTRNGGTFNFATLDQNGNFGIGTTTPGARLHALSTTEQLRLGYDVSNYASHTVSSTGDLTIAPTGGDTNITGIITTSGIANIQGGRIDLSPASTLGAGMYVASADLTFHSNGSNPGAALRNGAQWNVRGDTGTLGWVASSNVNTNPDTTFSRLSAGVIGVGTGSVGETDGTLIASVIGIGTTSPTTKLDVIGSASVSQDFEIGGNLIVGGNISGGTSISGNFSPAIDNTYSLGSADLRWKDIHVGPGSFKLSSTTGTSGATANHTLGQIIFGSGSSLSFGTSAVGTGSVGTLALQTAGTPRLYIGQTGNIGIGTTNPSGLLDVNGSSMYFGNSATNTLSTHLGNLILAPFTGQLWFGSVGGAGMRTSTNLAMGSTSILTWTNAVNNFYSATIDSGISRISANKLAVGNGTQGDFTGTLIAGNVGIGTTAPETKFNISVSTGTDGIMLDSVSNNSIYFSSSNADAATRNWLTATNFDNWGDFAIRQSTARGGNPFSAGSTRLVINNTGNVGIGTTGPGAKLHVVSNADSSEEVNLQNTDLGTSARTRFNAIGDTGRVFMAFQNSNYSSKPSTAWISAAGTGIPLLLGTEGAERVRIDSAGNVGIGTTNPTTKLDVIGSASISQNFEIGDATDGSDYVVVNSWIKSHLIPFDNARDVGSATNRWSTVFADKIDATEITGASTSFGGTNNETFTINADNATADTENSQFVFERGSPTTNAQLQWDATNKRFNINFPIFVQTTDPSEPSNNFTKITIKGATDQSTNDYFSIITSQSADLFKVTSTGNVGIGTTTPTSKLVVSDGSTSYLSVSTTGNTILRAGTGAGGNGIIIQDDLGTQVLKISRDGNALLATGLQFSGTQNIGAGAGSNAPNDMWLNGVLSVGGGGVDGSALANGSIVAARLYGGTDASSTLTFAGTSHGTPSNAHIILNGTSQGNVGIGTTGPTAKLNVFAGDDTDANIARFDTSAGVAKFQMYLEADSDASLYIGNASEVVIQESGNSWFNGGNVGIGTTTPGRKLDVAGTTGLIRGILTSGMTTGTGGGIEVVQTGTVGGGGGGEGTAVAKFLSSAAVTSDQVLYVSQTNASAAGTLVWFSNAGTGNSFRVDDAAGDTTPFIIDNSGNVGIGQTAPAGALDLGNATAGRTLAWGGTSGNYNNIFSSFSTAGLVLGSGIRASTSADAYMSSYSSSIARVAIRLNPFGSAAGSIQFFTDSATTVAADSLITPTERMRITSGGNVGIGTTDPGAFRLRIMQSLPAGNVLADITNSSTATSANGANLVIRSTGENNTGDSWLRLVSKDGGASEINWSLGLDTSNSQAFSLSKATTLGTNEYLTVLTTGNVGIGTTSPTTKLDVIGSASVSQNFEVGGNLIVGGDISGGTSISGNFDPAIDNTYSLGSADLRWKDIHVGPGSFKLSSTTGTSGATANHTLGNLQFASGASLSLGTSAVGSGNAGTVELRTANQTRLFVNSSGNVGIGTTDPSTYLHVGQQEAAVGTNGSVNRIAIQPHSHLTGPFYIGARTVTSTAYLDFKYGGSQVFTFDNNGRMGVGSSGSTPTVNLDVRGDVGNIIGFGGGVNVGYLGMDTANFDPYLMAASTRGLRFRVNGSSTDSMTILSTGNVGIGTTVPGNSLSLVGRLGLISNSGTASEASLSSWNSGREFWFDGVPSTTSEVFISTNVNYDTGVAFSYTPGTVGAGTGVLNIGQLSKNDASFTHGTTGLYTNGIERLRINSSGNVGIGTTGPTAILHVVGTTIMNNLYNSAEFVTAFTLGTDDWIKLATITNIGDTTIKGVITSTNSEEAFEIDIKTTHITSQSSIRVERQSYNPRLLEVRVEGADGAAKAIFAKVRTSDFAPTITWKMINNRSTPTINNVIETPVGAVFATMLVTGNTSTNTNNSYNIAGNVGIGTTNVDAKLEVVGTASISQNVYLSTQSGNVSIGTTNPGSTTNFGKFIKILSSSGGSGLRLEDPASGGTAGEIGYTDALGIILETMTQRNIIIKPGGTANVGIGTTGPGAKLHIDAGTNIAVDALMLQHGAGSADGTHNVLSYLDQSGASTWQIKALNVNDAASTADFTIQTRSNSFSDKFVVKDSGNVGIGTTAPSSVFQVVGGSGIRVSNASGNGGAQIQFLGSNTSKNFLIGNQENIGDAFEITPSTTNGGTVFTTPAFVILGSGNVGIGTTAPIATLDIEPVSTFAGPLFRVASGSNERMRITSSGNVGIRTTSPGVSLELTVAADGDGIMMRESYGGNSALFSVLQNTGDASGAALKLYDGNGSTKVNIESGTGVSYFNGGGNVGIGTTNPQTKLNVLGSGQAVRLTGANDTSAVYQQFMTSGSTGLGYIGTEGSAAGATFTNTLAYATFLSSGASGTALQLGSSGAVRMTILSTGNVGIGTTAPAGKLDIVGDLTGSTGALFRVASTSELFRIQENGNVGIGTTSPGSLFHLFGTNASGGVGASITNVGDGGISTTPYASLNFYLNSIRNGGAIIAGRDGNYGSAAQADSNLQFHTALDDTNTERMRITSAGNVGIGTTNPATKLDVWGTAGANDIFNVASSSGTSVFRIAKSGNVGIGTVSPSGRLHIIGSTNEFTNNMIQANGNAYPQLVLRRSNGTDSSPTTVAAGNGLGAINFYGYRSGGYFAGAAILSVVGNIDGSDMPADLGFYTVPENSLSGVLRLHIAPNGNVTMANYAAGNCCSDIAEFYPSSEPVEAADVMAVDPNGTTGTVKKAHVGDTVIGVVSTNPAIAIEEQNLLIAGGVDDYVANPTKPVIALAGRVPVKVSEENGQILSGDRLTLSATLPGYAMKMTQPGQSIGIAMEDSLGNGATGKVTVFVNLGYDNPVGNQPFVDSGGNIGIGTTEPAYKLHVTGDIAGTSFVNISTKTAKKDIEYLDEASKGSILDKLENLKIAKYRYNDEGSSSPLRLGLIAEEAPSDVLAIGGKGVDIYKLATFTLAGVQELSTKVSSQATAFEIMQAQVASLSLTVDGLLSNQTASGSVIVSSSGTGVVDTMGTIANAVMTRVQNLWASGDVIAEGIRKTYFAVSSITYQVLSIENWASREITIASEAPVETQSLFSGNGAQAAEQSKVELEENETYLATYGVDSTRGEIQLSGSSQLVNGEAKVFFDFSFSSIISKDVPLKVLLTPTTNDVSGQLVVTDKTAYGFTVRELNGASNGKFDWLAIARRIGYEGADGGSITNQVLSITPTPEPSPGPSSSPTPEATPEPTPEVTPTPESTPTPEATPEPEPSPSPSESPTPNPEPSPTPEPTPEPSPETTPVP